MNKWNIKSTFTDKGSVVEAILASREIQNSETFLNPPSIKHWVSNLPKELLKSLKLSREIIKEAMQNDTPIIIHGDYDADGINATAILYGVLKNELSYDNAFWFVPNRFEHGYGLSKDSIASILEGKEDSVLVITVDSGITSVEEVAYLKDLGHKVIITDHHQKPDVLPNADAIVWYDQVVGATLSWLLGMTLGSKNKRSLAYAALATVTDLQPLLEFNRSIVQKGIEIIQKSAPLGLKTLIEICGRDPKLVSTYDLGWVVGPRINATGRIEDASVAVDLLLSSDKKSAEDYSIRLNNLNTKRQNKTFEMYDIAMTFDKANLPEIIVAHNDNFHEGIIGLVAARLVQTYYRPSIVINTSEEIAKGSVRSIPGVNIIEFLRRFDDLFLSLGGHPMAAGFSIEKDRLPELKKTLEEHGHEVVTQDLLIPQLEIDMEIPADLISLELIADLDKMKPFGLGNRQPVFLTKSLKVAEFDKVGRESQHLKFRFLDSEGSFHKGIMFSEGNRAQELNMGDSLDVVYQLKANEFNGKTYIDLIIKDFKVIS